jgi:hypothetical protein
MKRLSPSFAIGLSCLLSLAASATVDDRITIITADLATATTDIADLANWYGEELVDLATTTDTFLDAIIVDIDDVLANGDGDMPDAGQITSLNDLKADAGAKLIYTRDYIRVGGVHKDCADTLTTLGAIDLEKTGLENMQVVLDAVSPIIDAKSLVRSYFDQGQGADAGIINDEPWAKLLEEYDAIHIATDLVDSLYLDCTSYYKDVVDAVADIPAEDNDEITNYDTALNEAFDAIDIACDEFDSTAAATFTLVDQLIALDRGSENYGDSIADAARLVKSRMDLLQSEVAKQRSEAAVGRAEIATRIVQRQLLFDSATYAQKKAARELLHTKLTAESEAQAELESVFADLTEVLEVEPIEFGDVAVPEVGGRSGMAQVVDANVEKYNQKLNKQVRRLNRKGANQELIDNVIANLAPAIYLQQTAQAIIEWVKNRANRVGKLSGSDYTDAVAIYENEWNEFDAELTANQNDAGISSSAQTSVAVEKLKEAYTNLFDNSGNKRQFKRDMRKLAQVPIGPGFRLKLISVAEFKRALVDLIPSIKKGSVTAAPTRRTNAANTTPAPVALAEAPDVTIDADVSLTRTLANGSTLLITGDGDVASRLIDPVFADSVTDKLDASLQIFMNQSARIGLGTANVSKTPGLTPNVLGGASEDAENSIQLIPDGNCFVDVNSDLFIGGGKAIVPTPSFGSGEEHRITFYSEVPRTITVMANTTLDLSDFGSNGSAYANYSKQIVFAGKVRLVLEAGAKIRFPVMEPNEEKKGPVLYFNDDSQIIFQGDNAIVGKPWVDAKTTGSDCKRNKILGCGQIWLNKNAHMVINRPAMVGIEADYTTPRTAMTFSLQRNSQFLIGSSTVQGGAFQIGNMFYGGSKLHPHSVDADANFPNSASNSDGDFVPNVTTIDFTMILNGPEARCQIGRGGFFGCAAGVINKDGGSGGPNGKEGVENSAWQLQRLYNTTSVILDIKKGYFDHNIIVDGDNSDCSMMAIGALANHFPASKYIINLGDDAEAFVRGGGLLYYVDKNASLPVNGAGVATIDNIHTVDVSSVGLGMSFSESNTGRCRLLAPSDSIRKRSETVPNFSDYSVYGRGIVKRSASSYIFAGPNEEFFVGIGQQNYTDGSENYVSVGQVGADVVAGIMANGTIYRQVIKKHDVRDGAPTDALASGYLRGSFSIGGLPTSFALPIG